MLNIVVTLKLIRSKLGAEISLYCRDVPGKPFASKLTDIITNLIKEGFLINALRGENRFVLPVISGTQGLYGRNVFALPCLKGHFQRHIYGLV